MLGVWQAGQLPIDIGDPHPSAEIVRLLSPPPPPLSMPGGTPPAPPSRADKGKVAMDVVGASGAGSELACNWSHAEYVLIVELGIGHTQSMFSSVSNSDTNLPSCLQNGISLRCALLTKPLDGT